MMKPGTPTIALAAALALAVMAWVFRDEIAYALLYAFAHMAVFLCCGSAS